MKFLVEEKGFNDERVKGGITRLKKARSSSVQGRIDSFFKVIPKKADEKKRKPNTSDSNSMKKKKKAKK